MNAFLIVIGVLIFIFIIMLFDSEPYPKKWEEEENKEFEKKFKEYEEKQRD